MQKKLKILLAHSNNASWFTLRHVLVIDYIFDRCKGYEPILSRDLIKELGIDQSTTNRILGSLADFSTRQQSLNWINYQMCKTDRRQREISLTLVGEMVRQQYQEC